MIQIQIKDRVLAVEPMSVLIYAVAFSCVIASFWDGWQPLYFALGLIIYDVMRFPYPNVMDVTDEIEDTEDDEPPLG